MRKTELKGRVHMFYINYNAIDTNGTLDVHRYLIKKRNIKQCLELLKKCLLCN